MDRTVEVIEKLTILVKNRALVVLLGQLVVDILILDDLGVVAFSDLTNPVRIHQLIGNRLLRCSGRAGFCLRLPFARIAFLFFFLCGSCCVHGCATPFCD